MSRKPRVLISACLLGLRCRYDGGEKALPGLERLLSRCNAIPVCPEQLGGLPTPRPPAERRGEWVVNHLGEDVTDAFERGAGQTCRIAGLCGTKIALLKARSPSCGVDRIYDGSFTGRTVPGSGVTAEALRHMGVDVYDETRLEALIDLMEGMANDTV